MTTGNRGFERQGVRTTAVVMGVEDGGRTILGQSRDISLSGIFVECAGPPTLGAQVQLVLGATSPALRCFARVVRVDADGFGGVFLDEREQARSDVEAFVERCQAQQTTATES